MRIAIKKPDQTTLTAYQRKIFRRYKSLLEVAGLDPEKVMDLAVSDPDAIVPVLELMINQVVRSTVVLEYTFVDEQLNYTLNRHFFGRGNKYLAARKTKRFRSFQIVLQQLFILQKLSVIQTFKKVPKDITSKIYALNDLRNGIAHTFFIKGLRESKRTYKGNNIFSPKGLELFMDDMHKVRTFFWPWLKDDNLE
jgi:hypothetical protein